MLGNSLNNDENKSEVSSENKSCCWKVKHYVTGPFADFTFGSIVKIGFGGIVSACIGKEFAISSVLVSSAIDSAAPFLNAYLFGPALEKLQKNNTPPINNWCRRATATFVSGLGGMVLGGLTGGYSLLSQKLGDSALGKLGTSTAQGLGGFVLGKLAMHCGFFNKATTQKLVEEPLLNSRVSIAENRIKP